MKIAIVDDISEERTLLRNRLECQFLFSSVRVSFSRIKISRFISTIKKEGHCKMQQPSEISHYFINSDTKIIPCTHPELQPSCRCVLL